ncbi:DUF1850 domain-containing protein [Gracilibacillus marinus]|jgi:hypothetical protein|uniref:DUF1850 domain-containing protein n=1 Tax=Gracilibacillus marinus TaxID=630535 RepID=A0ABV8VP49_9BACI
MRNKILLFVVICMLGLTFLLTTPSQTALLFYKENTSNIEAFLPLEPGDCFTIIFTHSIHLTDVEEKYMITNEMEIVQTDMIYEQFGIGMPSNAEGQATFDYQNGTYHLSNLNQHFEHMKIRNGKTVSNHRLQWYKDNHTHMVHFNDYFAPGDWFTVKVEKLSFLQYLKGVRIDADQSS